MSVLLSQPQQEQPGLRAPVSAAACTLSGGLEDLVGAKPTDQRRQAGELKIPRTVAQSGDYSDSGRSDPPAQETFSRATDNRSRREPDVHRQPPHRVEAEMGVLGSMIISPRPRSMETTRIPTANDVIFLPLRFL